MSRIALNGKIEILADGMIFVGDDSLAIRLLEAGADGKKGYLVVDFK